MKYLWPYSYDLLEDIDDNPNQFPPMFLQEQNQRENGIYVEYPDAMRFQACNHIHPFPTNEMNEEQFLQIVHQWQQCPRCKWTHIEGHRKCFLTGEYDVLDKRFISKFNSMEQLLQNCIYLSSETLNLVKVADTRKEEGTSEGPFLEKMKAIPDPVLENSKLQFYYFMKHMYKNSYGYVKGKYLVISPELLLRFCNGNRKEFMEIVCQADAMIQSRYCSITRLAFDGGFWQICLEFGGFFWRDTHLPTQFPFLKDFVLERNVMIRNFSLTMGPHYIIGGGYFSWITNVAQNVVIWFVPNLWQDSFCSYAKSSTYNGSIFWFGWYEAHAQPYGCSYQGVSFNECDNDLLAKKNDAQGAWING